MNRASHVGRNTFGLLAAGVAGVLVSLPAAQAQGDPEPQPAPATTAPAPAPADAAAPVAAPVDDCNAATLAQTISSVTSSLSEYFAATPRREPGADRYHQAAVVRGDRTGRRVFR